ncbi:hypothetical protein Mgra_00002267 [Meloidogyne graminicola]|uniref:Uncharacterized protein n=1 Tax=Meloidogyne graminicola TaxID=189291 RepID=A0A8S9ZZI1_9BILA|nr:hypothetical protein Mgra_00002267 [Meloidogyne graminicola]
MFVMSESDEESPEERMARIIGPRAEYDESNRRKELRKRLSRKAVRYRRWLMQTTMEKVCSVANPLNDGQEPIELTPEDCQKMSPNDYAPEFNCKMDVQQEATQLMLKIIYKSLKLMRLLLF